MIKEYIKKIYKSDKFPFLILIMIYTFLSFFMEKSGDDVWFAIVNENKNLFTFITERYNTWSSRVVIETILVIFAKYLPVSVWKISNLGIFYLLVYSISKLLIIHKNENIKIINTYISILIFLIPFSLYFEAGWIATSTNYLWVASTGLYTILLLKKIIKREKINVYQKIIHYICLIYACNQEQMAGILFIVYSIGIIYLIKSKNIKPIIVITYLIIVFSIIFILTCPGNTERKLREEITWYNGFSETSLMTKISNGINSMMDYMIKDGRVIFYIFEILLWYSVYFKTNNIIIKIIGTFPLVLTIFLKYLYRILDGEIINSQLFQIGNFVIYCLILIFIEFGILLVFKDSKPKQFIGSLIYFCGFISRFVMMFSPTVFASGERTSLFLYISLILLSILFIKEINSNKLSTNIIIK